MHAWTSVIFPSFAAVLDARLTTPPPLAYLRTPLHFIERCNFDSDVICSSASQEIGEGCPRRRRHAPGTIGGPLTHGAGCARCACRTPLRSLAWLVGRSAPRRPRAPPMAGLYARRGHSFPDPSFPAARASASRPVTAGRDPIFPLRG